MSTVKLDLASLTGPQKAAVFLLAMGEEFTASFFKKLDENSIKELGKHMLKITHIPSEVLNAVMTEFLDHFSDDADMRVSGRSFVQDVVNKSMDGERGKQIYRAIDSRGSDVPFADLAYVPAENLVNIIKGEHPQTIALILSYLKEAKAAEILSLLPQEMTLDIALRIVQIANVQDELIKDLDEAIRNDLTKVGLASRHFDGVETLANILNLVDGNTEEYLLSSIEKEDGKLAEKIREKMFVFEDLILVDDRSFREILRNVENEVVAKALKTASEEMKQKIFSNLSERAAEMLKEDMEVMGPVRLRDVEDAQQNILRTANRLESEGRIELGGKGKDDVFV